MYWDFKEKTKKVYMLQNQTFLSQIYSIKNFTYSKILVGPRMRVSSGLHFQKTSQSYYLALCAYDAKSN